MCSLHWGSIWALVQISQKPKAREEKIADLVRKSKRQKYKERNPPFVKGLSHSGQKKTVATAGVVAAEVLGISILDDYRIEIITGWKCNAIKI